MLVCISLFACQYWLSGALEAPLAGQQLPRGVPALDALLAAAAAALWWGFDRSAAGLTMTLLTAAGGPAIEVALINGPHLYAYTHPVVAGVPTWIPWVYAAGGPAVGLLGRRIAAQLAARHAPAEVARQR